MGRAGSLGKVGLRNKNTVNDIWATKLIECSNLCCDPLEMRVASLTSPDLGKTGMGLHLHMDV